MAEEKKENICDVSMSNADNGVIINYTEKTKSANKGTYDNYNYEYRKEVFAEDKIEDAFKRYKELFLMAREHEKSKKEA